MANMLMLELARDFTLRPANRTLTKGSKVKYLSRKKKAVLTQTGNGNWVAIPDYYFTKGSMKQLPK